MSKQKWTAADAIGDVPDGVDRHDPAVTPGRCKCGGDTWFMENQDGTCWQCELCGECYE